MTVAQKVEWTWEDRFLKKTYCSVQKTLSELKFKGEINPNLNWRWVVNAK